MQDLVRQAMREGALGVGSSLIYAPAFFAETPELIALRRPPRNQAAVRLARAQRKSPARGCDRRTDRDHPCRGGHGEAYHLKAAGEANWGNMARAIAKIEEARRQGVAVSANMYTYTAGSTGFDAAMPLWCRRADSTRGSRVADPQQRARVIGEIRNPPAGEENLYRTAGSPDRVLLVGFKNPALKPLTGKTLADVMKMRGTSAEDTIVDLVIEDNSRLQVIYFLMSEDNVKLGCRSRGSASVPTPRHWRGRRVHEVEHAPARLWQFRAPAGKYSRDEKLMPLEEAIRRITRLPATTGSCRTAVASM